MRTGAMRKLKEERETEFVRSLGRGLAVIRAFSRESPMLTLSEVSQKTGLTRAASRRYLLTLQDLGYVGSDGRQFMLRPQVLALGYAYLSSLNVSEIAQRHMEALVEKVHESCSASVLDGTDIVYVARVPTRRIMTIALAVGTRLPAHATSMGRVLLSELSEVDLQDYFDSVTLNRLTPRTVVEPDQLRTILKDIHRQGWALVDQELEDGVRSVAVPIRRGPRDATQTAINVSAHAARVSVERLRTEFLPLLQETAAQIAADLVLR
jgi:IclR family transcriptional regulator, pca regulon regulatory protein